MQVFFWYTITMKYLFDLDDTLYNCQQPFIKAMQKYFPDYCDHLDEKYAYYRYIGDVNFPHVLTKEMTPDENGESRIRETCIKYNIPYTEQMVLDFQQTYKYNQYHLELSSVFTEFFENNSLEFGILTNGEDKHQRRKIQALGLEKYVESDYIVTSMSVGISKPNPAIFDAYFEIIQDSKENWIYIGDAYENDIVCSHKAGLRNIYFDRHSKKEGTKADYTVYSEEELVELIQNLEKE